MVMDPKPDLPLRLLDETVTGLQPGPAMRLLMVKLGAAPLMVMGLKPGPALLVLPDETVMGLKPGPARPLLVLMVMGLKPGPLLLVLMVMGLKPGPPMWRCWCFCASW